MVATTFRSTTAVMFQRVPFENTTVDVSNLPTTGSGPMQQTNGEAAVLAVLSLPSLGGRFSGPSSPTGIALSHRFEQGSGFLPLLFLCKVWTVVSTGKLSRQNIYGSYTGSETNWYEKQRFLRFKECGNIATKNFAGALGRHQLVFSH